MGNSVNEIVKVLTAIVGVAILAVIVSKRSNTADVVKNAGDAFAAIIKSATGPVT